jgi:hypothetical protein
MDAGMYFVNIMWDVLCFFDYCISYNVELKIMIITNVKSVARLHVCILM